MISLGFIFTFSIWKVATLNRLILTDRFYFILIIFLSFLCSLSYSTWANSDIPRYAEWIYYNSNKSLDEYFEHRFEPFFLFLVWEATHFFKAEYILTIISSTIYSLLIGATYTLTRLSKVSQPTALCIALSAFCYFVFIDLSFNTIRNGLALSFLMFGVIFCMENRTFLRNSFFILAILAHVSCVPVIIIYLCLKLLKRKLLFFISLAVCIGNLYITLLPLDFDFFVLKLIEGSGKHNHLISFVDHKRTGIPIFAIIGALFSGILAYFFWKKELVPEKIALMALSGLFVLFPFSGHWVGYRIFYLFAVFMLPIVGLTLQQFPKVYERVSGFMFLIFFCFANLAYFSLVRVSLGLDF